MTLRKIINDWFTRRAKIKAEKLAEQVERRRAVIWSQMAARRARKQAWRPLAGSLTDATTEALRVETKLARINGLLEG
jgi:hypothetical protein